MEARVEATLQQLSQATSNPPFPNTRRSSNKTRQAPYPSTSPCKASKQVDNRQSDPPPISNVPFVNQANLNSHAVTDVSDETNTIFAAACTSIWNGKRGVACNWNKQGYLEIAKGTDAGLELCADWQRPNGCTSRAHPEKHRCSGCTNSGHGASSCPDGD
ncbi:hypothetical protein F5879DRAFT_804416 [Lentinula edodes]|nr:hypothetical protein F5879DRAFT_804416 [Lentinula edodes]